MQMHAAVRHPSNIQHTRTARVCVLGRLSRATYWLIFGLSCLDSQAFYYLYVLTALYWWMAA